MKKVLKILGVIFGVLGVLFVISVVLLIQKLPGPTQVGQALLHSVRTQSKSVQLTAPTAKTDENSQTENPAKSAAASEEESSNLHVGPERNREILENLTDPQKKKMDVCENLQNYRMLPPHFVYGKKSINRNFTDIFNGGPKDPVLEAVLAPIRLFMQQPQMKILLNQLEKAVEHNEEETFVKKASFYSQVYSVYNEMMAKKKPAEALMDRGYHLFMMAKAVSKKPSLLGDPQFRSYCQSIEDAANQGVALQWDAEQAEFQKFLKDAQIDPAEIGFDPNYKTHLEIESNQNGVHFHGGWLDSILP